MEVGDSGSVPGCDGDAAELDVKQMRMSKGRGRAFLRWARTTSRDVVRSGAFITFCVYLALALSCSAASVGLYKYVVFVYGPHLSQILIGVTNGNSEFNIKNDEIYFNGLEDAVVYVVAPLPLSCRGFPVNGQPQIISAEKSDNPFFSLFSYIYHFHLVKYNAPGKLEGSSMACRLPPHYTDVSFISRSLSVASVDGFAVLPAVRQSDFTPIKVNFLAEDATDVSILHENTVTQNNIQTVIYLSKYDIIKYTWNSESKRNKRDLILLVTGGLLGVVGAAILETIKLFLPHV